MSKIVAIAHPSSALTLGLAGIRVEEVLNEHAADRRVEELLKSDAEMLLIDEELRSGFSEYTELVLSRHKGLPLVIFCPAFRDEEADTGKYINAILKPAVGFEIRLD